MSRHQLQPTCAATAMCAKVLRLSSAASHAPTLAPNSRPAWATSGLCQSTSTGSGTTPSCFIMLSLSSGVSSAFGTRSAMVSSYGRLRFCHEDTTEPADVTTLSPGSIAQSARSMSARPQSLRTGRATIQASRSCRLFLDHPAVAVGVTEEDERIPGLTLSVLPDALVEMPYGCDLDATTDQLSAGGLYVRYTDLQALEGTGFAGAEPLADRD